LSGSAYLVFRDRFDFKFLNLEFEIEIVLSKFGKSVDRRQYSATEATRPSRRSTVITDRQKRSVALFCAKMGAELFWNLESGIANSSPVNASISGVKKTKGPVAQLVRAHA
jgi:hypothetical protein